MPWNWMQIRLHPPTANKAGYGEAAVGKGGLTYQEARNEVHAVLLTMAQPPLPNAAVHAEAAAQWSRGVPDDVLASGLLVSRVYEYGRLPGETADRAARVLDRGLLSAAVRRNGLSSGASRGLPGAAVRP